MKVNFKSLIALSLVLVLTLFLSCTQTDESANPTENEAGTVKGKIIDSNGNPLPGADVVIDNTMFYNSNILTTTDNQGMYKAKLPTVGTYVVTAKVVKELNGKSYTLDLHPEQTDALSNEGGIRNFQLKLTGKKPDGLGYYGATVGINAAVGSTIYDSENIEFTLEPAGKLIDGSTGKTLVVKEGAAYTQDYGYLVDIPLGRYTMKAFYSKNNTKVPLKIRKKFDAASMYSTTFLLDFDPETSFGKNIAIIEYEE